MSKSTILIIEDDPMNREGMRILLEGEGYQVMETESGEQGLELLNDQVELVLLDVMMPGMGGLRTCEEIRKVSNVPVLFITAKSQESDKLVGLMAGGDDYLTKPFSYSELLGRVKALLRRYTVYQGKVATEKADNEYIEIGRSLYISAHPLDNYDAFFEEQTIPLHACTPQIDGQKVSVGGLVSTIRTIVTKAGTKMAFVGIEDKTSEAELIVFPRLYEQLGDSLQQDAIVKVAGTINARDRDGNMTDEAKIIADEISIVTDKELNEYQSHGRKMTAPKGRAVVKNKRYPRKSGGGAPAVTAAASAKAAPAITAKPLEKLETVYVKVKNPSDRDLLVSLKKLCSQNPGQNDIIMILGDDKSNAIRLPFRVDAQRNLRAGLAELLGDECVKVK